MYFIVVFQWPAFALLHARFIGHWLGDMTHAYSWGYEWWLATTDVHRLISPLHLTRSWASLLHLVYDNPVHSLMLSHHCFLCLPLFLLPSSWPSMMWDASGLPLPRRMWPKYLSFRLMTLPRSSRLTFNSIKILRLVRFSFQLALSIFLQNHISAAMILFSSAFSSVQLSAP